MSEEKSKSHIKVKKTRTKRVKKSHKSQKITKKIKKSRTLFFGVIYPSIRGANHSKDCSTTFKKSKIKFKK